MEPQPRLLQFPKISILKRGFGISKQAQKLCLGSLKESSIEASVVLLHLGFISLINLTQFVAGVKDPTSVYTF